MDQPRTYVLNTTLKNAYVKVALPVEAERDDFEQTLLDAGLLKEGFPAAGDELGRGIAESSAGVASSIQSSAAQHTQGDRKEPMHVPKTLEALASQASSATQQAQDFTHKAAETIGHYAEVAGATTASYVKQGLQKTGWFEGEKSEARQTAENVAEGFSNAGTGIAQGFGFAIAATKRLLICFQQRFSSLRPVERLRQSSLAARCRQGRGGSRFEHGNYGGECCECRRGRVTGHLSYLSRR